MTKELLHQYAAVAPIQMHAVAEDVFSWRCWLCQAAMADTDLYRLDQMVLNHMTGDIGMIVHAALPPIEVSFR